jgi:HAD superfamily phosphatase (TIGR01668 family)
VLIYPKIYLDNVKKIDIKLLKEFNIKGLLLDVDNTLIDTNCNLLDGIIQWCEELKNHDIKICILSNTPNKNKVINVANQLKIPYIYFAKKPFKSGFLKGKEILKINNNNEIAAVGDQILTDVIGANRTGMISILVNPISKKDLWITQIKRPIENLIIKSYCKKYGGK